MRKGFAPTKKRLIVFAFAAGLALGATLPQAPAFAATPPALPAYAQKAQARLTAEVTPEKYQELLQEVRSAVEKDFPERMPDIFLADMSKPMPEALQEAAAHFHIGIEGLEKSVKENIEGIAEAYLDGDPAHFAGGIAVSHLTPEGRYVCIAFPNGPKGYANVQDALKHMLHETAHCLDPEIERNERRENSFFGSAIIHEAFAEGFAVDVLKNNGAATQKDIKDLYTTYAKRYHTPGLTSDFFDRYQAYEALQATAKDAPVLYSYQGKIGGLKKAFLETKSTLAQTGYTNDEAKARMMTERDYTLAYHNRFHKDEKAFLAWAHPYKKLPELERLFRAKAYAEGRTKTPYVSWKKIDYVKSFAQITLYARANPTDPTLESLQENLKDTLTKMTSLASKAEVEKIEKNPAYAAKIAQKGIAFSTAPQQNPIRLGN